MAEQLSSEDLTEFFYSLRCIIKRTALVYHASDLVGLHVEICERRLEKHKNAFRHITVTEFLGRRIV